MPKYTYTAIDNTGTPVSGVERADDIDALRARLTERALRTQHIEKKRSILQLEITKKKVPPTELMHFSRQLGAFVRAGLPIVDAIDTIATEASNPAMTKALRSISVAISEGRTFSSAASEHPHVFPAFYVRTLRSAELTGKLDSILSQLSRYIERDEDAKRQIRAAMIYPAIVAVMAVVTVVVLMVFVLPRFKTFFSEFDATLPLPTRILLDIGGFVTHWWAVVLVALTSLVVLAVASQKTRKGRYTRDALLLKLPVIGDVVRYAVIERFCRILASMIEAAVTIPEAMEVATDGANNLVYEDALGKARKSMLEGHGLSRPIAETGLFPNTVTQMLRVGEDTGTLDAQLQTAAEFYDVELGYKIKRFTTLVEPTVITVMGGVVGFVAISLVSAMYGIFQQVRV